MKATENIHIGTSGWHYPHWRKLFYPEGLPPDHWLTHYSSAFNTVEINNTFYHLPDPSILLKWKDQAPPDFSYAVKAHRFITHLKKLKEPAKPLTRFLELVRLLRPHLGPILYQLPARWNPDLDRLRTFCAQLPDGMDHVMEFRGRAWLNEDVYAILAKYEVGLCLHDMLPRHPRRLTSGIVYVRFHGAGSKYGGSYTRPHLRRWAKWLQETATSGRHVYVYFNNDAQACAVRNAQTLRSLIKR